MLYESSLVPNLQCTICHKQIQQISQVDIESIGVGGEWYCDEHRAYNTVSCSPAYNAPGWLRRRYLVHLPSHPNFHLNEMKTCGRYGHKQFWVWNKPLWKESVPLYVLGSMRRPRGWIHPTATSSSSSSPSLSIGVGKKRKTPGWFVQSKLSSDKRRNNFCMTCAHPVFCFHCERNFVPQIKRTGYTQCFSCHRGMDAGCMQIPDALKAW